MIHTLFQNSAYRFFYSADGKSYDPRLIISYQPRCFYEFYCKGFHKTKTVLIAVWPLSGFSTKCVDEKIDECRAFSVKNWKQHCTRNSASQCNSISCSFLRSNVPRREGDEEERGGGGRHLNDLILIITHIKFSVNKIMLTVKLQSFL